MATITPGRRCRRPALLDSDYCEFHEPARHEQRLADLVEARRRSPRNDPANLETLEAIQGELAAHFERAGTWKPLAEATGISNTQLRRYLAGAPDAKIMRRTVERIRRGLAEVADAALAHAA